MQYVQCPGSHRTVYDHNGPDSCSIVHIAGRRGTHAYSASWKRSIPSRRPTPSARPPLPADERRLLLPLRAHRTLGTDAAADAGVHVVPRGDLGPDVARDGGGAEPDWIQLGDLALVPHGEGHRLSERARGACAGDPRPSTRAGQRSLRDPSPRRRRRADDLICGAVRFDHPAAGNLVALLPKLIHGRRLELAPDWNGCRARSADGRRGQELRPGGEAVITRLADILVIQAIRSWMASDPAAQNRMARRAPGQADRPRHRASSIATRAGHGPSPPWPTSSRCPAPRSPPASPSSSASR